MSDVVSLMAAINAAPSSQFLSSVRVDASSPRERLGVMSYLLCSPFFDSI